MPLAGAALGAAGGAIGRRSDWRGNKWQVDERYPRRNPTRQRCAVCVGSHGTGDKVLRAWTAKAAGS